MKKPQKDIQEYFFMECKCKIKEIMNPRETEFLRHLFRYRNSGTPETEELAVLEGMPQGNNCEFLYSWGFSYYCANPEIIKKFSSDGK
ncbi:MAG: hypothetical protein WC335_00500 [Candidatus Omnitrophota bacterium]